MQQFQRMIIVLRYIIISFMMLGQLIQLICDYRPTDTGHAFQIATPLPICEYLYNTFLQALLEMSETLGLKNTTKFLAKKYLDVFLCAHNQVKEHQQPLITLTCLKTAVNFNQFSDHPDLYTFQYCISLSDGKFSVQQFLNCEAKLLKILNHKFKFPTPYDFIITKGLIPSKDKFFTLLESVIDFCLTLIQSRSLTAQQIFLGCLLYCCKEKNLVQTCYTAIKNKTAKWEISLSISCIIQNKLNQLLQQ